MVKKISKIQAKEEIDLFFSDMKSKNSKNVRKMKKLAMNHNIKLGDRKKLFCKKCFTPHNNSSINLKKSFMNIICGKCAHKNRWKLGKDLKFNIDYKGRDDACC